MKGCSMYLKFSRIFAYNDLKWPECYVFVEKDLLSLSDFTDNNIIECELIF